MERESNYLDYPIKTQFEPTIMFRVFKENLKLATRSFSLGLKSNQCQALTQFHCLKLPRQIDLYTPVLKILQCTYFCNSLQQIGKWSRCRGFDLAVECMKWLPDVFSFKTSKINKMSKGLPLAFYAGLRIADLPGPWHYKG